MKTFEELLKPVFPELVRYSRAMAGSSTDGDDLLQDALLKAWQAFHTLRGQDGFKYWLLRIIRNTSISRERSRRLKSWLGLDAAAHETTPETLACEDRELVRTALGRLPRDQREALILYEILGLSVQEICFQQRSGESAVKSRLSRARKRLRSEVEALGNEEKGHGQALAESY